MSEGRLRIRVSGSVQGVGFRPFVHRLARELELAGWVRNEGSEVLIEAQGARAAELAPSLLDAPPQHARIESVATRPVAARPERGFRIAASEPAASRPAVLPDLVTCEDCLRELFDPESRFHRYSFTSCSHCGPRFSIVERTPYDRANTTMAAFTMCSACRAEYEDPAGRRFHAQPTACPDCGPQLSLLSAEGRPVGTQDAIATVAAALREGRILALKGLGGFQLLVDAADAEAIGRLRRRKRRPAKPFALLVRDLEQARELCRVSEDEEALLSSPAGPIVLLEKRDGELPEELAPGLRTLGLMLPATPLHHLLAREAGRPLVCTSGNLSDEPLCLETEEALERLGGIADLVLTHDRPIHRAVDDSVARVIDGEPQLLRLARGHAPLSLALEGTGSALALGAHLKSSVALAVDGRAQLSQHLGDLESSLTVDAMRKACAELREFYEVEPETVACDLHPDYASSAFARESGPPVVEVQHHLAHALAVMAEHELHGPLLAVTWDGTGLGADRTIWGGEFLRVERTRTGIRWSRAASLLPFRLPGGDAAARDARRSLAGLAWEVPALRSLVPEAVARQLERQLNAPPCTSAGRLFDGLSALLGLCGEQRHEAEAAARFEAVASPEPAEPYELPLRDGRLDWRPLLEQVATSAREGTPPGRISASVHETLARGILAVAAAQGLRRVVLTGGCTQNRRLTERTLELLRGAGHEPLLPRRVPPNDGGLALGQLLAALEGFDHVPGRSRTS